MDLRNYKEVEYSEVISKLEEKKGTRHELSIASDINVKSVNTVKSVFNAEKQVTSDEVFTKVLDALGIEAIVGWVGGKRTYFLSNK